MSGPNAIDISNWQGVISRATFERWKAEGVRTVILGTSGGGDNPPIVYTQQGQSARDAGLGVEAYIWLTWPDADSLAARVRAKLDLVATIPEVKRVWLDCEDEANGYESPDQVEGLIALARDIALYRGYEVGIYTGAWWWSAYAGGRAGFANLPLWLADYDRIADLDSAKLPFGGWTTLYRKQYTDKGELAGVYPLDFNVEEESVAVAAVPPVPEPPAPSQASVSTGATQATVTFDVNAVAGHAQSILDIIRG